jgi:spore coat polysaccharide biosynthesis protein SpsF
MILGIVQARTSSSRLPGKILKPILGTPMLEHQIRRLRRSRGMDKLIVATSSDPSDDPLAALARNIGIDCFRGSLDDVLDRFFQAARTYSPEHVVRLTGDCPLADPAIVDAAIRLHLETGADYTTNAVQASWPDGLDVEVCRFASLEEAWREARLPSQREHVTPFINQQPQRYRITHMKADLDLSHLRWTVDEPADLVFVNTVYERLYPVNPEFTTADILSLLEREPALADMNSQFQRNEGLAKSLQKDRNTPHGQP